ncbi:MAG: signal peptidase I [Verrucomicrobiota bacterium]
MKMKVSHMLICRWLRYLCREYGAILLFILFVVIPVRSSLADWNAVPSGSMNPTILEGDLIFVNKAAYDLRVPLTLKRLKHLGNPERGDICVFFSPVDRTRIVKRVVALPGDRVELENNHLMINGIMCEYSPLQEEVMEDMAAELKQSSIFAQEIYGDKQHAVMSTPRLSSHVRSFPEFIVPDGHYFIMGDNRDNSMDSRHYGPVERRLIIGKAHAVIGSLDMRNSYRPRLQRFFHSLE